MNPLVVLLSLALLVASGLLGCSDEMKVGATVADLQVVHEGVQLDGRDVLRVHRLSEGMVVETKPDGRARLRLDDGTMVIVDGATKLMVSAGHGRLDLGRIFVVGGLGARTTFELGEATVTMTGGHAGIERRQDAPAEVYAASGELVVRVGDKDSAVRTGESATIEGTTVKVAPERVFDDWTGGLASPWSATGQPRRVVGALWGGSAAKVGDPGSPLTLRSQQVQVQLVGETALTQVHSTFFHAGSTAVRGDYRMALPQGALVAGFAAGLNDDLRRGNIGMAARNDEGDNSQPTLEWAGDGWVRASFQSISPGTVVHVVVEYAQWLERRETDKGFAVEYRFPLASESEPPVIGEFSMQIDTTVTPPREIRCGHGAVVNDGVIMLRKSDFRPTADFVAELELAPERTPARVYVTPDEDGEGSYVLVRAEAPESPRTAVRLAVVLDASASMDAGAFETARTFVQTLVRSLGAADHVVVLAADMSARPLGPPALGQVDDARRKEILDALSAVEPGGASDVGRGHRVSSRQVACGTDCRFGGVRRRRLADGGGLASVGDSGAFGATGGRIPPRGSRVGEPPCQPIRSRSSGAWLGTFAAHRRQVGGGRVRGASAHRSTAANRCRSLDRLGAGC